MKRIFSLTRALVARKRKIFALFFALAASIGLSWAAGIPCTAADLGKVLCTDGSIYATVSDATAANKTAVAMIAYIDAGNNKGLALALVEEKGNANWSEAISKCAAKTPTITGGTWKLASEDEWNKIIDAVGGRNALRDGFSAIGGSNLKSDGNDKYWSSTESSNTEKGRCICFNNTFGGWSDASKTTNYPFYARACLAFNIGEPDPTITVGALEHGSVVASATTAEAGATITLTATPEAGYKLNTIEATYFGAANETLRVTDKKNVGRGITAEYNKSNYIYVSSFDGAYNLTVSTNDGTNLIRKIEIEFYGPGVNDARKNSMLSSDKGSWTFEDGDPCTKATINNINAVSVVLSGSGTAMNQAWSPKTMKVYYDGDVLIDLTDTEDANVKTFTMVNKAVNVFAEFIPTGSCGENLTWEYSPSTGALVISGTGAMSDYDNNMNKAPWYAYRESISSITFPDGLTYIGKHAFRECNNFTQLVVPNSVTEIGNTAFQDCSKLWNLTLPNTLEKIGGAAFERTNISNFTIPEGVTSLDGYVFGECTSLYRVNIHAGVTSLTGNVFYNCTNLNTIYCYAKNPVAITGAVFEGVNKANCKLYVSFTSMAAYQAADEWKDFFIKPIPGTAPTLYLDIDGASATLIYGYPEGSKPAYDEEYGQWNNLDYSYRYDNLKTLTIDVSCRENVMTSFKNLFQYFRALETIRNMAYLSTVNVTNMEGMFEYCEKLTELDLHTFNTAKVTNMENMFSSCSELVTLDISSFNTSNVTSMYYMFSFDDKLQHIYVGDGWNTDNVTEHDRMFQYCGELPNYNSSYTNKAKAHTGDGGYLTALTQIGAWESGDCDVILYSNGRMSVTKKAGNGNGAMANYANKDAQPWADSRNLVTKLDIEDGVKEIGTCAFYDFRQMTQLNIHEGVTAIHENAFRNGLKLTTLILPSTLRVLGDKADAFTSCPITDIYLTAHPARLTWNEDNDDFIYSFSNPDVHKTTVCHVPANLADAYVAKFITGVEADKQPNVTFEGGMPAVDMITPEDVIALINEIGEVAYTAECKAKIDAAREAYDGLVDEDKAQVTNLTTLTDAETAYAGLLAEKVAPVIAAIDAVPATPLTPENTKLSEYNKVKAAREAYNALSDDEKAAVTNYDKLTAAEAAFAAIPSVGSETVITWDKNTGIEKMSGTATSPAYEGITISIKGGGFGPQDEMLRFNIAGLGLSFEFANTLGGNFQKIVISSTNAMPSTPLAGMGEGWAASNENKTATWTGDAATVKIWDGLTATSYWDVNTIQFTLGATVSATEAAQTAKDLIDAIGEVSYPDSKEAIKAAREAVDALGANASLLDDADLQKLTDAEAAYAQLLAQAVKAVKDQIDALPATPLTPENTKLSEYNKVTDARALYDALTDEEKAAVTNYGKLTAAEAAFAAIKDILLPSEALSGAFTIGNGIVVYFSPANLQYTRESTSVDWSTGRFSFMANQYDIIETNANPYSSDDYANKTAVSLFGWATSNISTQNTYYQPWETDNNSANDKKYGSSITTGNVNWITNYATYDWGTSVGTGWRTLKIDEWMYLFNSRTNAASLRAYAKVHGTNGMIILPDGCTPTVALNTTTSTYNTNTISDSDWASLEAQGAVFLPAAGRRDGMEVKHVGTRTSYWTSTSYNNQRAYYLDIDESTLGSNNAVRSYGYAVRLVADPVTTSPLADAQAVKDLIDAIGEVSYPDSKEAIKAAREALDALSDETKALFATADTAALPAAEATYADLLAQKVAPVIAAIDAVPATPLTEATKKLSEYNKVTDARALYDALTDEEKAAVTNYGKLTAAEAAFAAIGGGDAGALKGKFSVADGKVVYFSKGNLQATTTDLGANWTWSFAANQWNTIGNAVANTKISGNGEVSENGTVDLFGWSTSTTFYGIHNSTDDATYYASFVDWSSNTDLIASLGEDWRTLTSGEWTYLLNTRTTTSGVRYAKATVNTVAGLIILPDNWDVAYHALASTNNPDVDFNDNKINSAEWASDFQAHGAVFLPAAGNRNGTNVSEAGSAGYYWSATSVDAQTADYMYFNDSELSANSFNRLLYGRSVRLVTENAPASPLADAQAAKDLINAIPQPVVYTPECSAAIKAAREALDALSDEAKALFATADTAALPAAETAYADLLAEKVAPVIAAIDAVPATPLTEATKKLSEYNKVTDARALYDALTDEEKAAVDNYDKLTAAEAAFAAIGGGTGLNVSTEDIGKVLCADGSLYATKDEATAASKTPVAMIAYVEDSKGLAIALEDESNTMTWSPAITAAAAHTPAVTGGTWKLPSLLEWQQMFVGCGADLTPSETSGDVTDYLGLRDKLLAAGGNGFVEWSYWTTTEWADNPAEYAWDPYFSYSPELVNWYTNKKTRDDFYIRAILAFNVVASNDLAQAQAAKYLIDAIPQPVVLSDECKAKIDAAREAVTALGENASLLDDADIDKLAKAEADFALLIKDATAVVAKIDAIGDVTFSAECKEKIVDAREAYEALADELKPYVTNLGTLTDAEAAYEAARPFAPVTTVPAAVEALQYTGVAQTLITAGVAEHGTILYSLDGVDYSAELPTALLPGTYTVYYKVQATDDYKDVAPATFTATIAYNYPATYGLFGIPEGWSVKVNDEEVAVVNGAVKNIAANDRFDIMPVKPEDVKLVEVVPYLLDLATATDSVIYLMNGDSITGTANGNISIVIVPDAKVYFKDVNLTNTGSHPAVLCGGNAEIVVVGENSITCTTEGEYGIRTAGAGTTLTVSGDKTLLKATIDPNGGTVNQ